VRKKRKGNEFYENKIRYIYEIHKIKKGTAGRSRNM
jgi:hypothetical protein